MEINDLIPLKEVIEKNNLSEHGALTALKDANIAVYIINPSSKTLHFDEVEYVQHEDGGRTAIPVVYSKEKQHLLKGKIFKVNTSMLMDIVIGNKIRLVNMIEAKEPDLVMSEESLRNNTWEIFSRKNLYVRRGDQGKLVSMQKPREKTGPKSPQPHIQLIREAIEKLGNTANSKKVFYYIKSQPYDRLSDIDIEFEGEDLIEFDRANMSDPVLRSKGKTITKKTIQNACSEIKNKK